MGTFSLGMPLVFAFVIFSTMQKESIFLSGLVALILLGWFIVFSTLGRRMIWAALTAPSVPDDSDEEDENHMKSAGL